jgi:hypothetical protein
MYVETKHEANHDAPHHIMANHAVSETCYYPVIVTVTLTVNILRTYIDNLDEGNARSCLLSRHEFVHAPDNIPARGFLMSIKGGKNQSKSSV